MRSLVTIAPLLLAGGCNAIFGLDPVGGGHADDAPPVDAAHDAIEGEPDANANCVDPGGAPDEDGDGRRDECDDCPQSFEDVQNDADGDGVGDVCDPHMGTPDRLVAFYGFNGNSYPPDLRLSQSPGAGSWYVAGGQLHLISTAVGHDYLAAFDVGLRDVTVDAQLRLTSPIAAPVNGTSRSIGVWADIDIDAATPEFPTGVVLEAAEAVSPIGGLTRFAHLVGVHVVGESNQTDPHAEFFLPDQAVRFRLTCTEVAASCDGSVVYPGAGYGLQILPATTRAGSVGLRVYGVDATADYLAIYAPR